jgi:hypothetical protein
MCTLHGATPAEDPVADLHKLLDTSLHTITHHLPRIPQQQLLQSAAAAPARFVRPTCILILIQLTHHLPRIPQQQLLIIQQLLQPPPLARQTCVWSAENLTYHLI